MKNEFIADPDTFKKIYGDSRKTSCTFGKFAVDMNEYHIVSDGDHSRDEVILALRLYSNQLGKKLTDDEIFWYRWVLGYQENLDQNYPELDKVKPAVAVAVWKIGASYSASSGSDFLTSCEVKQCIEEGRTSEVEPSVIINTLAPYALPE